MATTAQRSAFSAVATIRVKSQDWYKHLPEPTYCSLASYKFGELIEKPEPGRLGVVLSGSIEICDESQLKEYYAYRPIRILEPGDVFNDFTIADKMLGVPETSSETWKIYAGRRSVLVLQKVKKFHAFCEHNELKNPTPHLFLNAHSKEITKIAYLDYDKALFEKFDSDRPQKTELFVEILSSAWKKASAYRFGINSYNLSSLIDFRRILRKNWEIVRIKGDGKGNSFSTQHASTNKIQPLFADALFEALERPTRGDPVFAHLPESLSKDCWSALAEQASVESVLTACDPSTAPEPFYYPIDLHNLEINSSSKGDPEAAEKALGCNRVKPSNTRKDHEAATTPHLQDFFQAVANKLIADDMDHAYPFKVSCVTKKCLVGRMLLLEFRRK